MTGASDEFFDFTGWLFSFFGGTNVNGFDIDSVYGAVVAVIGAIILSALYYVFLCRRMR